MLYTASTTLKEEREEAKKGQERETHHKSTQQRALELSSNRTWDIQPDGDPRFPHRQLCHHPPLDQHISEPSVKQHADKRREETKHAVDSRALQTHTQFIVQIRWQIGEQQVPTTIVAPMRRENRPHGRRRKEPTPRNRAQSRACL